MKRKIVLPNFSNYVIYPTLGKIWSKKTKKWIGRKDKKGYTVVNLQGDDDKNLATHHQIQISSNPFQKLFIFVLTSIVQFILISTKRTHQFFYPFFTVVFSSIGEFWF